jgi:hypothetical protein
MTRRRLAALLCVALAGTLLLTGLARAAPGLDQQQATVDEDKTRRPSAKPSRAAWPGS